MNARPPPTPRPSTRPFNHQYLRERMQYAAHGANIRILRQIGYPLISLTVTMLALCAATLNREIQRHRVETLKQHCTSNDTIFRAIEIVSPIRAI